MSNTFRFHLALSLLIFAAHLPAFANPDTRQNLPSAFASQNFWQLNQAIVLYQNAAKEQWPLIPENPHLLKLGTKSYAILLLRDHLRMTGDLLPENDIGGRRLDSQLSEAIKIFQARHGLKPDGVVGSDTRMELNISPADRAKQIAINMQRWADLADKLGNRFVWVNIPDFHMYLYDNNQKMLSLRVIVGKKDLPTPELSSRITRIVLNPYWNIPKKIAQKDIARKMLEDPSYAYKMHIKVLTNEEDNALQINPRDINWEAAAYEGLNYHLRQDPGPDNALGLVKFEFQNSHDVYMHDTSAKDLFNTDTRDYSHGCIRLENPFALAEYLLKDSSKWNQERIQNILDIGKTTYVKVPDPIPIFITYITSWVDEEGRVNFRDDLYQMDNIFSSESSNLTDKSQYEIYN